jgi:hypothetical protein
MQPLSDVLSWLPLTVTVPCFNLGLWSSPARFAPLEDIRSGTITVHHISRSTYLDQQGQQRCCAVEAHVHTASEIR